MIDPVMLTPPLEHHVMTWDRDFHSREHYITPRIGAKICFPNGARSRVHNFSSCRELAICLSMTSVDRALGFQCQRARDELVNSNVALFIVRLLDRCKGIFPRHNFKLNSFFTSRNGVFLGLACD